MWQRRLVALLVVVGVGLVVPGASAGSRDPKVKELPRPARSHGVTPAAESVVVKLAEGASTTVVTRRGASVVGEVAGTGFVRVRPAGDPVELVALLRSDPSVVAADLDYPRRASVNPNDPLYPAQPPYPGQQPYLNTVRLPAAWDLRTDASSQVIAIVDSGVDVGHPDLMGRLVGGFNAVSPGAAVTDELGHGTFVAGVAAANTNNAVGVAGAAWNGRIMPVKVFTDIGGGDFVAFDSDVAVGIVWAVDHGAKIVNLSLGGPGSSEMLHAAVQYATDRGVVVIVASGNDGNEVPQYPAAFPEVLAVGATDHNGALVDFSSYGDWLDLAAPGFAITSTYPAALGFQYATGDGTSFAAPIVSGVAALVRAQNPTLTGMQVADRLRAAARDAGPRGHDPYYGYGVLDAARALGATFAPDFPLPALGTGEPNDVPASATPVGLGTSLFARSLAVEGDVDWYRYVETTTRNIRFAALFTSGGGPDDGQIQDPILEIFDADLERIADADQFGPGATESLTLPLSPGTYYVKVRNYNGAADTTPYALDIETATDTGGLWVQTIPMDTGPRALGLGDVTGDGLADLVVATRMWSIPSLDDNKVLVMPQLPGGGLGPPVRYNPVQSSVNSLTLLDVDRDGLLDVVVAGNAGIEVLRQDLGGNLESVGLIPGATDFTSLVVSADVDGDTDEDLVAARPSGGIDLFTHGAGSSFTRTLVNSDFAVDLALADVDGNGSIDIVGGSGFNVAVYHNPGWMRTQHLLPANKSVNKVAVGDVSGEGRTDIIAAGGGNAPNGVVDVFTQNVDGTLAAPVVYDGWEVPSTVKAADVNNDSLNDVILINNGFSTLSLYYQQLDGSLGPRVPIPVPQAQHPTGQGLIVGHLDGDGLTDLVAIGDTSVSLVRHPQTAGPQEFVLSVLPPEYLSGVSMFTEPQVTFKVPLNPSTVNSDTVRLLDGRTGTVVPAFPSYDEETKTVSIGLLNPMHDSKPYRIVVDGVEDVDGNVQPWRFTSTFTTENDAPPALEAFTVGGYTDSVRMSWVVPGGDLDVVMVRMAPGTTPPGSSTAGNAVYTGIDSSVTIGGLIPGTTYSFSVWWRDRSGAVSVTPRTATLFGNTLTIATTSSTSVQTGSTLNFTGALTRVNPSGPLAGQQVALMTSCRGAEKNAVVGTAVSTASGGLSVDVVQVMPACSYWWELAGAATFMGATSTRVQVNAIIPTPPGGTRER